MKGQLVCWQLDSRGRYTSKAGQQAPPTFHTPALTLTLTRTLTLATLGLTSKSGQQVSPTIHACGE